MLVCKFIEQLLPQEIDFIINKLQPDSPTELTSPVLYFCTDVIFFFHMSNSRECMGVNGEALELCAVYKKSYFILQVMRGSVSGSLNPIGQHLYMSVT